MIFWKLLLICFLVFAPNDSWKKKLKVVNAANVAVREDNYYQGKYGQCPKPTLQSSGYSCEYKNPCDDKPKPVPADVECESETENPCEVPEKKPEETPREISKISKTRKQGACNNDGISVTVDCEECELQIKAGGGGVFLKCKKCNELKPEDNLLPPLKPYRVIRLP